MHESKGFHENYTLKISKFDFSLNSIFSFEFLKRSKKARKT